MKTAHFLVLLLLVVAVVYTFSRLHAKMTDADVKLGALSREQRSRERKYRPSTTPVIAIDLDGTIWPDCEPDIGRPYPHAVETINGMLAEGYQVIIWTTRGGTALRDARDALEKAGLRRHKHLYLNGTADYYRKEGKESSPKVEADVYLDDKNYEAPDYSSYWLHLQRQFLQPDHWSKEAFDEDRE